MRKMKIVLLTFAICFFALLYYNRSVSAEIHYDLKLNRVGREISLTQKPIAILNFYVPSDYCFSSLKADFNQDGKSEMVRIKIDNQTIKIEIDGKKVLSTNTKMNLEFVCFKSYKVGKNYFAVLLYGKRDLYGGKGKIFKWEKGNKLKLLKSRTAKGTLSICPQTDSIIIRDSQQLQRKEWSSVLTKKYSKWKNKGNVALTKTTYSRYIYTGGKLKSKGTETYYRIGKLSK